MRDTRTRATLIAVLAVAMVAAWGCRRRPTVVTGGMTEAQHSDLMRLAARDTRCDQSQLSPSLVSAPPNVFTVSGCGQPVEYWQQCSRRRCRWRRVQPLHEVASPALACPTEQIQQQMTAAPAQRQAMGCGRMASFQITCTGRDCAWIPAGGVMAAGSTGAPAQGGVVVASPPPVGGGTVTPTQVGTPSAALQAQVQQQREAVLSCLDPGVSLTLSIRWTADGQIILQLPQDLAGTAAEGCIHAALGALTVAAQQAGEISVPIN